MTSDAMPPTRRTQLDDDNEAGGLIKHAKRAAEVINLGHGDHPSVAPPGYDANFMPGAHSFSRPSNRWKDDDGKDQERTAWHRVSAFNRAAEIIRDNVTRGMRVLIEGPMEYRGYEKDGTKMQTAEIVLRGAPGERLNFLSKLKGPQPG